MRLDSPRTLIFTFGVRGMHHRRTVSVIPLRSFTAERIAEIAVEKAAIELRKCLRWHELRRFKPGDRSWLELTHHAEIDVKFTEEPFPF